MCRGYTRYTVSTPPVAQRLPAAARQPAPALAAAATIQALTASTGGTRLTLILREDPENGVEAIVAGPGRVCDRLRVAGLSSSPHSLASGITLGYQHSPRTTLDGTGSTLLLKLAQPATVILASPGPRQATIAAARVGAIAVAPALEQRPLRLLHQLLYPPRAAIALGVTRVHGRSRLYVYAMLAEGRKAGYLPNITGALASPEGGVAAEAVGLASRLTGDTGDSLYLLEPPAKRGCMIVQRGTLARLARLLAWSQATCPTWDLVCTENLWHLARSISFTCPRTAGRPRLHLERPEHLWPARTRAPREAVERLLEAVCSLHSLEGCSQAVGWASTAAEPPEKAAEKAERALKPHEWT